MNTQLTVSEAIGEIKDPLFKKKLKDLFNAMKLAEKFKRIEICFLQMVRDEKPVFAILPYDSYKLQKEVTYCKHGFYQWADIHNQIQVHFCGYAPTLDVVKDSRRIDVTGIKCTPTKSVPPTVDALVGQVRPAFDAVFVAWEAEWNNEQKDPNCYWPTWGILLCYRQVGCK